MNNKLEKCTLCPRNCGVNRLNGQTGYCGAGKELKVARAALHFWEEPCLSGSRGSGTVFFSNCNLGCVYCQNHTISQEGFGMEISVERLSDIFIKLQKQGAHNINLVTPTHYIYEIIDAIKLAKDKGLEIPIVYNSSGYEKKESIALLNGLIDVYVPDIKYFNSKYSASYSKAKDYFSYASKTLEEMFAQRGKVEFDKDGLIQKGVIVRHLMLPGLLFDSKKIIDYLYYTYGDNIYISIMNQYTPMHKASQYVEINKLLNPKHYDSLIDYALSIGVKNGFIQESSSASDAYVPSFDLTGV